MNRLLHFFQYNNAVPIIFAVVILGAGSAFAATNPEVFIDSQQNVVSPDTTYIASADVTNFDFQLKITDITEDSDNYYVVYTYRSIGPVEYVWKEYITGGTLTVSHREIEGKDLGIFVARQLGELLAHERTYLREVQVAEKARGASSKVVVTEYSGLIGKFLDTKEEVFPGYVPVVAEESTPIVTNEQVAAALAVFATSTDPGTISYAAPPEHTPTQAEIDARIELKVREILGQKSLKVEIISPSAEPVVEPTPPSNPVPAVVVGESQQTEGVPAPVESSTLVPETSPAPVVEEAAPTPAVSETAPVAPAE